MFKKTIVVLVNLCAVLVLSRVAFANTIPVGGGCGLVDAISAANEDIAVNGCVAGSGADTILLENSATYILASPYSGQDGLPVISGTLTIIGNSATITRTPSAPQFRILHVGAGASLYLSDMTISGGDTTLGAGGIWNAGYLELKQVRVIKNNGSSAGGVAHDSPNPNAKSLIESCLIDENTGSNAGGVYIAGAGGLISDTLISNNKGDNYGGINNIYSPLTIVNSKIMSNTAMTTGGGIMNYGIMTITHSSIISNTADYGGGLYSYYWGATIDDSLFQDNYASRGGGIFVANYSQNYGDVFVLRTVFDNNKAKSSGGGVYVGTPIGSPFSFDTGISVKNSVFKKNLSDGLYTSGGAIYNEGRFEISNSTLLVNIAYMGGAIFNRSNFTGTHLTLFNNTANIGQIFYHVTGTLDIRNSLTWVTFHNIECIGTTGVSGTGNLSNSSGCTYFTQSSTLNLGPIGNYGGNTQTFPLLTGSSAIDSADQAYCLPIDQRGFTRPVDGDGNGIKACDVGAYEYYPQSRFLPYTIRDFAFNW